MSTDLLRDLKMLIGQSSLPRVSADPVNAAMIRHWCEAMGDTNPVHVDPAAATASIHGGIVAPAAMLEVWTWPGLVAPSDPTNPFGKALTNLSAAGFTSILAVNSELELLRPLRLGEHLRTAGIFEDISDEKQTAMGRGHFVTMRYDYWSISPTSGDPSSGDPTSGDPAADELVGRSLFRVFKFAPGTGRAREAASSPTAGSHAPATDATPSLRPRPAINRDNQFFWDGCRAHELRIQTCDDCGKVFFPPTTRCFDCGSFSLGFRVASGRGTLYSWAVPQYPQVNGFAYPLLVGLIELEEGVRIVSNLVHMHREHLRIGMPLELCWLDSHPALDANADDSRGPISLHQFRPAAPARRPTTLTLADVAIGDQLPLCPIPLTATSIVAGALATRDFTAVHNDRDVAQRAGSADLFMNIQTSIGLTQRYLGDWAGPEAVFRNIRVRLGVPNYPGDTMTMDGRVTAIDEGANTVTVDVRGFNGLGNHVNGTAEIVLGGGGAR